MDKDDKQVHMRKLCNLVSEDRKVLGKIALTPKGVQLKALTPKGVQNMKTNQLNLTAGAMPKFPETTVHLPRKVGENIYI